MYSVRNSVVKSEHSSAAHQMRCKAILKFCLDSLFALCQRVLINSALKAKLISVLFAKLYDIVAANRLDGMNAVDTALDKIVEYRGYISIAIL